MEKHEKKMEHEPPPGFFGIRISDRMNTVLGIIWWVVFLFFAFCWRLIIELEARR